MLNFNENIILAEKYSKKKKYKKAIGYWEKALKIDPSFSTGWVMMGQEHEKLLQWEKSLECYDKALQINPQDNDVKLWRDELLSKTQNISPEELRTMRKEELKMRKKERKMINKETQTGFEANFKIFIIASCICSLVLGFAAVGIYIYFVIQNPSHVGLWVIIPIAFAIGLSLPLLVYLLSKLPQYP